MEHKQLFRNGVAVREPWARNLTDHEDSYRDSFPAEPNIPVDLPALQMLKKNVVNGQVVVPAGKYFVMGDNRDQSLDSRYWGFIDKQDLMGRPLLIYGSSQVKEGDNPTIFNTRWNRLSRLLI
jgi:signal peptidase I